MAGVKFSNEIIEGSRGKTTKGHFVNKLFSNSVNRANLDILDQKVSQGIRTRPSNFQSNNRMPVVAQHDQSLTVTADAQAWLKNNFGVNLDSEKGPIPSVKEKPKMKRTFSARPGFRSNASVKGSSIHSGMSQNFENTSNLGAQEEPMFKIRNSSNRKRPMSAYSHGSRISQMSKRSRLSSAKSVASFVPKLTRANALTYCNKISSNRLILDNVKTSKFNARDKLTPSEIQNILQGARVFMDISAVRGFLNHLRFPAHGKSCSILDLIRRCKEWNSTVPGQSKPAAATYPSSLVSVPKLIMSIRDLFYKSRLSIKEIFENG